MKNLVNNKISSFTGKYRFLSNFFPARVTWGENTFPSVENAYQASKFLDKNIRKSFIPLTAPEAKHTGKDLTDAGLLRPDWHKVNLNIMENLLRQKFSNDDLKKQLLMTYPNDLIEGNWWGDIFWGICKGKGENHLGQLLMKIRNELYIKTVYTDGTYVEFQKEISHD